MELERHSDDDRIRVSDREREQVVALLGQAAGEGRLTLDEYTERVDQVYTSKTRGELAHLTEDLPVGVHRPAVTIPGSPPAAADHLVAIFGEDSRKGAWVVPQRLAAQAVFGECSLEFQDAQIQHQVTTIDATAIFGSVVLYVPEGVTVRLTGTAVFGSKESKLHGPARPGAPVIEVNCRVIFGAVMVRPPKRRWLARG